MGIHVGKYTVRPMDPSFFVLLVVTSCNTKNVNVSHVPNVPRVLLRQVRAPAKMLQPSPWRLESPVRSEYCEVVGVDAHCFVGESLHDVPKAGLLNMIHVAKPTWTMEKWNLKLFCIIGKGRQFISHPSFGFHVSSQGCFRIVLLGHL